MRYSVYSISEDYLRSLGGKNIKTLVKIAMVFVDLDDDTVGKLVHEGYKVMPVKDVRPHVTPPAPITGTAQFTTAQLLDITKLNVLKNIVTPPLYGEGLNIALLDTGIRETHQAVAGHIVDSKNFTADIMEDGYDHGTAIASIITEVCPKTGILNLKVIDSNGYGTEEEVAIAIDYCLSLKETNPDIYPMIINISLGTDDYGDTNTPMRVACRAAISAGIFVVSAAGNEGPYPETIMSPACEEFVIAVGSCSPETFLVSSFSSRGPTKENLIKPDCVFFGENIIVASAKADNAVVAKSGTSFAAPLAAAVIILGQEGAARQTTQFVGGLPAGFTTNYHSYWTIHDLFTDIAPRICTKPQGVAGDSDDDDKDNSYGFGLPVGQLIMNLLSAGSNRINGIISTAMMIMVMIPLTKNLRNMTGAKKIDINAKKIKSKNSIKKVTEPPSSNPIKKKKSWWV
jgi:serine protease AprX